MARLGWYFEDKGNPITLKKFNMTALDAASMHKWTSRARPSLMIVEQIALLLSSIAQEVHVEDNSDPPVACHLSLGAVMYPMWRHPAIVSKRVLGYVAD